jgi:mannose-6-phosphate isomerase-like protein (cupin superfamily)
MLITAHDAHTACSSLVTAYGDGMNQRDVAVPPPHVHREHDEVFYILNGPFRFLLGHEWVDADTGSLVVVPRGTRHGFETQPDCRALLLTIPAGLEGFFTELGQGLAEGMSSQEIRARLAGRYDSHPDSG